MSLNEEVLYFNTISNSLLSKSVEKSPILKVCVEPSLGCLPLNNSLVGLHLITEWIATASGCKSPHSVNKQSTMQTLEVFN